MFHIIGFILIVLLIILIIGLGLIASFIRSLFGLSKRTSHNQQSTSSQRTWNSVKEEEEEHHSMNKKKIFAKDEGEYVDFEEI